MDRLHPTEQERAVLGGIIYKNNMLTRVGLTDQDWSNPIHRSVWRAMQQLANSNIAIDELTLEAELSKMGLLEAVGGLAFLSSLALHCPTVDNVLHYADTVKEAAYLRRLRETCSAVERRITDGANPLDLQELLHREDAPVGASDGRTFAEIKPGTYRGFHTGLGLERYVPGGLPTDKVTTIYGETEMFKTTVKNHLLFNLARTGRKVLDVSLEDSAELTLARYAAQRYSLPYGKLAAQEIPMPALDEEDRTLLNRIVDGTTSKPRMRNIIALARNQGVAAVFIDYIQLLDGCSGDHTELAEAMRQAQLAAKEDNIAYVFLSQVKQDVNFRANQRDARGRLVGDPRPRINDCLGSSSIRTGTKLGLGIFRPWKYCPVPTEPDSNRSPYARYCNWINNYPGGEDAAMEIYPRVIEIIIGKNVLGPSQQTVYCLVELETGRLQPWEGPDPL